MTLEAWPETPVVILSAAKNLLIHWILRPFAALRVTEIDFPATLLDDLFRVVSIQRKHDLEDQLYCDDGR